MTPIALWGPFVRLSHLAKTGRRRCRSPQVTRSPPRWKDRRSAITTEWPFSGLQRILPAQISTLILGIVCAATFPNAFWSRCRRHCRPWPDLLRAHARLRLWRPDDRGVDRVAEKWDHRRRSLCARIDRTEREVADRAGRRRVFHRRF